MSIRKRFLADTLTVFRFFIAGFIVLLSFFLGKEDLPIIVYLTLAGWASDSLDGPLARSDRESESSWIGSKDHYVDLIFATSLLFFMWNVDFVATHTAILYISIIAFYFLFGAKFLFQFYMALVYGSLLFLALIYKRNLGAALLLYGILNMILDWKRFKKESRDFIGGFIDILTLDFLKKTST